MINQKMFLSYLKNLLSIDSVSGFHEEIQNYVIKCLSELKVPFDVIYKGGVIAHLGNKSDDKTMIMAHLDTIGMMVKEVNSNGTLNVCPIGGLSPVYEVGRNVTIHTMDNKIISGAIQKVNSSVHSMNSQEKRSVEPGDFVVVLDYDVRSRNQVYELGIKVGDMIAPNPSFEFVNGYVKSRFLDDKAAAAIILTLINEYTHNRELLLKSTDIFFTTFEETGHGATVLSKGVKDIISLEVACIGNHQNSNEHEVSIYPYFGGFVSNRQLLKDIVICAEINNIPYNLDVIINGGNDNISAITAGNNVRHCAVGFGTMACHGYERTHIDSINATYNLLLEYLSRSNL